MSVLNIAFHEDEVWFLSDTMVYSGEGHMAGLCARKAHIATSGRYMWSTRGSVAIGDGFDQLAEMAGDVDHAARLARAYVEALPDSLLAGCTSDPVEITVAGWSEAAGDLVVMQLTQRQSWRGRRGPLEVRAIDRGVYLLPTSASAKLPRTVTEGQFIRLALAQHKMQDVLSRPMCLGGVMHMTVINRHGAGQRIVGIYPDHEAAARQFGCPNAEAVAQFLAEREAIAA